MPHSGKAPAASCIGHVHLRVSDLDRAIGFYRDVLGFPLNLIHDGKAASLGAGDGDIRVFCAAAMWRVEDVAGSGRTTTVIGDKDLRLAIVQLPPRPGDATREDNA